jgi:hypothetical protein
MTVLQALTAVVSLTAEDNLLEKALIDNGLAVDTAYTSALSLQIDSAAVDALVAMLSQADVSEGGFSISYDSAAIMQKLTVLAKKTGRTDVLDNLGPTISSAPVW